MQQYTIHTKISFVLFLHTCPTEKKKKKIQQRSNLRRENNNKTITTTQATKKPRVLKNAIVYNPHKNQFRTFSACAQLKKKKIQTKDPKIQLFTKKTPRKYQQVKKPLKSQFFLRVIHFESKHIFQKQRNLSRCSSIEDEQEQRTSRESEAGSRKKVR